MKQFVLTVKHRAEAILSESTATKNRPVKFKVIVVTMCLADIALMIYCMISLVK
jgi:hypothetical protein